MSVPPPASGLCLGGDQRLRLLRLGQEVCELLEGRLAQLGLWPEVRGEVSEGHSDGSKGRLGYKRETLSSTQCTQPVKPQNQDITNKTSYLCP